MKIQLNTTRFCIGTSAKKKYEELLKTYFKFLGTKNDRLDLEEKIEGLKFFLEHVDISKFRNKYPQLDKSGNTDLILEIDTALHIFSIRFHESTINLPLIKNG